MPINKIGGKKGKKKASKNATTTHNTDYLKDKISESYGRVEMKLGSGRFIVACSKDGVKRNCRVCGRLYKRKWINEIGTIVLVALHDQLGTDSASSREDLKGEIIVVYDDKDIHNLIKRKEITKDFSEEGKVAPAPAGARDGEWGFEDEGEEEYELDDL